MKRLNKEILITGGAGYIGQNLVNYFLIKGYKIFVIDNLSTAKPIKQNIRKKISFHKIDLTDEKRVKHFFKSRNFHLIIHLAAFSGVKEFDKNVQKSFNNNILATKNLVRFAFRKASTKLIFASSAAVYGKVSRERVNESKKCNPANYYGLSKLACENIIKNQFKNKKNKYAILRYFNVVGYIIDFRLEKKINSLFDILGKNINKKKYKININGNNFDTKDGTPERDFIHILDLCTIHEKVFEYLNKKKTILINCGTSRRYSVLEVVRAFEKKAGIKFKISFKITNSKETHTICSNNFLLKKLLKINLKKNKLNDLIKEYI